MLPKEQRLMDVVSQPIWKSLTQGGGGGVGVGGFTVFSCVSGNACTHVFYFTSREQDVKKFPRKVGGAKL